MLLGHGADPSASWQGHTPYGLARIYGNRDFADTMAAGGHATPLTPVEKILADCADGVPPDRRSLEGAALDDEERRILTRIILMPERLKHSKALVAAGIDPNQTEEMGMTPLHLAGWAGLPEQVAWLLGLGPDLTYRNTYGGDAVGTILHGSEHRLDVDERDHIGCLRLVLEAGAPLDPRYVREAGNAAVAGFLEGWLAGER